MQAGKRYSLWQTLNWSKKYIFIFLIINSIPVVLYEVAGLKWFAIPWQPISLVGIAVAFYIGFKNNSSYERLWEARKIWGGIVNSARSFTILSRDYITNEFATEKVSENELHKTHKTIVHRHVAWLKALTYQLRQIKAWEHNTKSDNNLRRAGGIHPDDNDMSDLQDYLSNEEYEYVMQKGNVASHIISLQSKHLKKLRHKGLMDDFRHMELGKLLTEFYSLQGKSERIKNFPFPRQYASLNAYFVMIFILLLPFSMLDVFGRGAHDYFIWLSIPFTTLISWVFHTMEMVGEYSENPFEGLYNDVPITSMARGIEIDIRQMIDETDLPETIEPFGEMKILI
jgi:putative membrane protein